MAKQRIRIIRKTKEGALLDMKEQGKKLYPWEEFNKYYNIIDNVWAESNEALDKMLDELEDKLVNATTWFLMAQGAERQGNISKQMTYLSCLGDASQKLQDEYGFSLMQVYQLIHKRVDILNNPNIKIKETPEEYRERHARQAEEKAKREAEERNYRRGTISNATNSMSCAKGADKLKELFNV